MKAMMQDSKVFVIDNLSIEEIKKEFPLSINSKNKNIYHNKRTEWVQSNKEAK